MSRFLYIIVSEDSLSKLKTLQSDSSLTKAGYIEVTETIMDKDLIDGARELFADELFETVRRCYCEANKDYLNKQIKIASEYMTDEQKEELRQRGITI